MGGTQVTTLAKMIIAYQINETWFCIQLLIPYLLLKTWCLGVMTRVMSLTNHIPTFRELTLYFPSSKSLYCPTTKTKDPQYFQLSIWKLKKLLDSGMIKTTVLTSWKTIESITTVAKERSYFVKPSHRRCHSSPVRPPPPPRLLELAI